MAASTLSDDEHEAISYLLADSLAPRLAVALSSCSRGLRRALAAPLKELKERRQKAEELCAHVSNRYYRWSCDRLRDATRLDWTSKGLTAAHTETLGMLLATNGLPKLNYLNLNQNPTNGVERLQSLVGGLGRRALPSLMKLIFFDNSIGNAGAAALAAALSRGAMPSLRGLQLSRNTIGDQGLIALAAPLRRLPALTILSLLQNQIGDEGLAALVAPGEGVLPKLENLSLNNNPRISNAGCAAIVAALEQGALPRLERIGLSSLPGVSAVEAARPGLLVAQ